MEAAARSERVDRRVAGRPLSVKLYVASVPLSMVTLLAPGVSHAGGVQLLLSLVLLVGVWAGSRLAWGLTLAWLLLGLLVGLGFATDGRAMVFTGITAVWIGLLVLAPTRRWVEAPHPELRAQWASRPVTLRIYVVASLTGFAFSVVSDSQSLEFPWILFTLISFGLLLMLWNGSAGVWWWSVISYGITAVTSLVAAFNEPAAWNVFVVSASAVALLVAPATRAWFNQRIAERFP